MIQRYQFHMFPGSEVTEDPEGLWCMQSDTETETRRADSAEAELQETAGELERLREQSDSWCRAHQAWQHWGTALLRKLGLQSEGGEHGDGPAREIIGSRLTAATALLERLRAVVHDTEGGRFNDTQITVNTRQRKGYRRMRDALLSRTPSPPIALPAEGPVRVLEGWRIPDPTRGIEAEHFVIEQPAAPTPASAALSREYDQCPMCERELEAAAPEPATEGHRQAHADAKRYFDRMRSAESKLAAVRAECESVNGKYQHPDQLAQAVCRAFDNIRALLTPAPSPCAGGGK